MEVSDYLRIIVFIFIIIVILLINLIKYLNF